MTNEAMHNRNSKQSDVFDYSHVTARIKRLLKAKGKSDYWLAKQLNVTSAAICQNMKGKNHWGMALLVRIAKLFNVSLNWLVWGREFNETEELTKIREERLKIFEKTEALKAEKDNLIQEMKKILEEYEKEA